MEAKKERKTERVIAVAKERERESKTTSHATFVVGRIQKSSSRYMRGRRRRKKIESNLTQRSKSRS